MGNAPSATPRCLRCKPPGPLRQLSFGGETAISSKPGIQMEVDRSLLGWLSCAYGFVDDEGPHLVYRCVSRAPLEIHKSLEPTTDRAGCLMSGDFFRVYELRVFHNQADGEVALRLKLLTGWVTAQKVRSRSLYRGASTVGSVSETFAEAVGQTVLFSFAEAGLHFHSFPCSLTVIPCPNQKLPEGLLPGSHTHTHSGGTDVHHRVRVSRLEGRISTSSQRALAGNGHGRVGGPSRLLCGSRRRDRGRLHTQTGGGVCACGSGRSSTAERIAPHGARERELLWAKGKGRDRDRERDREISSKGRGAPLETNRLPWERGLVYRVVGPYYANVRETADLGSPRVCRLAPDRAVVVQDAAVSKEGVLRLRVDEGWVSERLVEAGGQLGAFLLVPEDEPERVYDPPKVYKSIDSFMLNVRKSVEIEGDVVRTLPPGTEVEVFERRRNKEGVMRLKLADGWINERRRIVPPPVSIPPRTVSAPSATAHAAAPVQPGQGGSGVAQGGQGQLLSGQSSRTASTSQSRRGGKVDGGDSGGKSGHVDGVKVKGVDGGVTPPGELFVVRVSDSRTRVQILMAHQARALAASLSFVRPSLSVGAWGGTTSGLLPLAQQGGRYTFSSGGCLPSRQAQGSVGTAESLAMSLSRSLSMFNLQPWQTENRSLDQLSALLAASGKCPPIRGDGRFGGSMGGGGQRLSSPLPALSLSLPPVSACTGDVLEAVFGVSGHGSTPVPFLDCGRRPAPPVAISPLSLGQPRDSLPGGAMTSDSHTARRKRGSSGQPKPKEKEKEKERARKSVSQSKRNLPPPCLSAPSLLPSTQTKRQSLSSNDNSLPVGAFPPPPPSNTVPQEEAKRRGSSRESPKRTGGASGPQSRPPPVSTPSLLKSYAQIQLPGGRSAYPPSISSRDLSVSPQPPETLPLPFAGSVGTHQHQRQRDEEQGEGGDGWDDAEVKHPRGKGPSSFLESQVVLPASRLRTLTPSTQAYTSATGTPEPLSSSQDRGSRIRTNTVSPPLHDSSSSSEFPPGSLSTQLHALPPARLPPPLPRLLSGSQPQQQSGPGDRSGWVSVSAQEEARDGRKTSGMSLLASASVRLSPSASPEDSVRGGEEPVKASSRHASYPESPSEGEGWKGGRKEDNRGAEDSNFHEEDALEDSDSELSDGVEAEEEEMQGETETGCHSHSGPPCVPPPVSVSLNMFGDSQRLALLNMVASSLPHYSRAGSFGAPFRREMLPESSPLYHFAVLATVSSLTFHRERLNGQLFCPPPKLIIVGVERIFNASLQDEYLAKRNRMAAAVLATPSQARMGGCTPLMQMPKFLRVSQSMHMQDFDSALSGLELNLNEFFLFHGCRRDKVDPICLSGFDCRRGGENRGKLFGIGSYFAENASKGDIYCDVDTQGGGLRLGSMGSLLRPSSSSLPLQAGGGIPPPQRAGASLPSMPASMQPGQGAPPQGTKGDAGSQNCSLCGGQDAHLGSADAGGHTRRALSGEDVSVGRVLAENHPNVRIPFACLASEQMDCMETAEGRGVISSVPLSLPIQSRGALPSLETHLEKGNRRRTKACPKDPLTGVDPESDTPHSSHRSSSSSSHLDSLADDALATGEGRLPLCSRRRRRTRTNLSFNCPRTDLSNAHLSSFSAHTDRDQERARRLRTRHRHSTVGAGGVGGFPRAALSSSSSDDDDLTPAPHRGPQKPKGNGGDPSSPSSVSSLSADSRPCMRMHRNRDTLRDRRGVKTDRDAPTQPQSAGTHPFPPTQSATRGFGYQQKTAYTTSPGVAVASAPSPFGVPPHASSAPELPRPSFATCRRRQPAVVSQQEREEAKRKAARDPQTRCLLIARVLLGESYRATQPMPDASLPPSRVVQQQSSSGGGAPPSACLYDSVWAETRARGGVVDHHEYVVYERGQALPQFCILYQHAQDCQCSECSRNASH